MKDEFVGIYTARNGFTFKSNELDARDVYGVVHEVPVDVRLRGYRMAWKYRLYPDWREYVAAWLEFREAA